MTTTSPHDAAVAENGQKAETARAAESGGTDPQLTPPIDPTRRHRRDSFHVAGEGLWSIAPDGRARCVPASGEEDLRAFRFSRLGHQGTQTPVEVLEKVATAMVAGPPVDSSGPAIPAGFTYLGQFVDHDLTGDRTEVELGEDVTVDELKQGRSPALDLDSLYGRGPVRSPKFYEDDGVHLKLGATVGINVPAGDPITKLPLDGFDLPRAGEVAGGSRANKRAPLIPDGRNDENLAVAQTHAAFIRFHNRVVDQLAASTPTALLFDKARRDVALHYQWMLREDFLPRIVDRAIIDDVFTSGRRFFEVLGPPQGRRGRRIRPGDTPTMPIEFSVAAYRLGHSMIRDAYNWNRVFNLQPGALSPATLVLLFTFTGVNGNFQPSAITDLDNPDSGTLLRLPSNWIADFRRLYDFGEAGRTDLVVDPARRNVARRIDTSLVDPLGELPLGSFNGRGTTPPPIERNLAFRNLVRANMVMLASGQQMAEDFELAPLSADQVLRGAGGADTVDLTTAAVGLSAAEQAAFGADTPLWFYILREAELNGGVLTGVGGRIVAEVFHRAMEGSTTSIVRNPLWRPTLGRPDGTFHMVDLLLFAFEGKEELLNPLGDTAPGRTAPVP